MTMCRNVPANTPLSSSDAAELLYAIVLLALVRTASSSTPVSVRVSRLRKNHFQSF
jgi:hypothetical protein